MRRLQIADDHTLKDYLAYLAINDIELGSAQRIPLWLFGFLREKRTRIPQHSKSPQVSGQVSKQAGLQIVAA